VDPRPLGARRYSLPHRVGTQTTSWGVADSPQHEQTVEKSRDARGGTIHDNDSGRQVSALAGTDGV